ncbi:MAG: alpha/beta hydrolase [Parvularcula sp.]|jgi:hypothetical protein|nr:alpha/beta hydrolase [Parvularcula sp.]
MFAEMTTMTWTGLGIAILSGGFLLFVLIRMLRSLSAWEFMFGLLAIALLAGLYFIFLSPRLSTPEENPVFEQAPSDGLPDDPLPTPPPMESEEPEPAAGPEPQAMPGAARSIPRSGNTPYCVLIETCTPVRVLYGTSRLIDYDIPAEQDGDTVDNELTPFLDTYDEERSAPSLGFITVTVPGRASLEDNQLFRPREPNRLERLLRIGPTLDGERHYIFRDYDELSEDQFRDELDGKARAFVYIHGYQEGLITAAFRAAQIKVVGEFEGQAMTFSWPSVAGLSEENYFEARRNALRSGEKLRQFLTLTSEALGTQELHIIAHSMGNFALLEALDDLAAEGAVTAEKPFDQIIMAAPDVSVLEYERLITDVRELAQGATLYASRNDVALRLSRTACQRRRDDLENRSPNLSAAEREELTLLICDNRAGYVPKPPMDVPVIVEGVHSFDASYVDKNTWWHGIPGLHGYAFEDSVVFSDIGAVMDAGRRSPIEARGDLVCLTTESAYCGEGEAEGRFWRFF